MKSDCPGAIRLITALSAKWVPYPNQEGKDLAVIGKSASPSNIQRNDLLMIAQGLRGFGSEHVAVESILHKLKGILRNNNDIELTNKEFSTILNGLQSMGGKPKYIVDYTNNTEVSISSVSKLLGFGIASLPRKRSLISTKLQGYLYTLSNLFENRSQRLTASMIAASLYGLQVFSTISQLLVCHEIRTHMHRG